MSALSADSIAARLAAAKSKVSPSPSPPPAAPTVSPPPAASPSPPPAPDAFGDLFGSFTSSAPTHGARPAGAPRGPGAAAAQAVPAKKAVVDPKSLRVGGDGRVWQDTTLSEWPEGDHRIFVGNIANDVTSDMLVKVFNKYPSFLKAKVVRDERTDKTRGYGFVSFAAPEDMLQALRAENNKYIGMKPVVLKKSSWNGKQACDTKAAFKQLKKQDAPRNKKYHFGTAPPTRSSPY